MRTFKQEKLWRDKAAALLECQGSRIHTRHLTDAEFIRELHNKLHEEVNEVIAAQTRDALQEECADVVEVLSALCGVYGVTLQDVLQAQERKREQRGGFEGRTYVTVAEHPVGSFGEKYCLADPDKYPEIE